MNKNLCLRLSIVLLVAVLIHIAPSGARAAPGPATFTEIQPLVFGLIAPGAAGGTLTVSDTGAVSVTGTAGVKSLARHREVLRVVLTPAVPVPLPAAPPIVLFLAAYLLLLPVNPPVFIWD